MSFAGQLGISERTIKTHLESIFQKFGGNLRAAAITVAKMAGKIALEKAQGNENSELLHRPFREKGAGLLDNP
jgi:hypothetical protein